MLKDTYLPQKLGINNRSLIIIVVTLFNDIAILKIIIRDGMKNLLASTY